VKLPLIDGVVPVIPTPFRQDEEVDLARLQRLIDFAVESAATAICLPAYGSEFYKLSDAERDELVAAAIRANNHRVPTIAQANHVSAKLAEETAKRYEKLGADIISIALPRQFPVTEVDLLRYCGRIADAVSVPLLIQDFNPGGPTVSADFLCQLHRSHQNIRFAKLEEPLIVTKLKLVQDKLGGEMGLLTGWGGMYLLDGLVAGSCGVMPGTAICDLFAQVWRQARSHGASNLFASLLPYINFSLQTFELFLAMEKHILLRRGLLQSERRRDLTRTVDDALWSRSLQIIDEVLQLTDRPQVEA
jgi:4-hydroxy-tetrahydrodipicolinate synthase